MELPPVLREGTLVFYLVLRALDSIEDDMNVDVDKKKTLLLSFFQKTSIPGWSLHDVGEKETERHLLREYNHVHIVYKSLQPEFQKTIDDICQRMGAGMAEFLSRDVRTIADYELYCHYVAGLVGIGLSRLWGFSRLENEAFATPAMEPLSNAMGLFLQKTNITRDYREDVDQSPPRVFYPRSVWARYVDDIADMKDPAFRKEGVQCVNHMVADALRHAPASIDYLSRLRHPDVFRFCAIPQVMAIATLERCYNNPQVLDKVVKIRKGEALVLIEQCSSFEGVLDAFAKYASAISRRVQESDPSAGALQDALSALTKSIQKNRH